MNKRNMFLGLMMIGLSACVSANVTTNSKKLSIVTYCTIDDFNNTCKLLEDEGYIIEVVSMVRHGLHHDYRIVYSKGVK
jgi:hypothetical protein